MGRSNFEGLAGLRNRASQIVIAALLAVGTRCVGQAAGRAGITTVTPAVVAVLEQMTQSAGVIFAGQVVAVHRPSGHEGTGGATVTIDFRVDQAVRGCTSGSVYTLKEWGGLWSGNADRYRVGQRLLLFLHQPGASGLSSPVHGAEGVVSLRGGGVAPGPYDGRIGAGEWVADLRWVQAQGVRSGRALGGSPPGLQGPKSEREPGMALVPVEGGIASALRGQRTQVAVETAGAYLPLPQVLGLCRGWMGAARVDR